MSATGTFSYHYSPTWLRDVDAAWHAWSRAFTVIGRIQRRTDIDSYHYVPGWEPNPSTAASTLRARLDALKASLDTVIAAGPDNDGPELASVFTECEAITRLAAWVLDPDKSTDEVLDDFGFTKKESDR